MIQLFHFEHRSQPLASPRHFSQGVVRNGGWALLLIVTTLALGMAGYMYFEDMGFAEAFVNAAMILSGMGPMETRLSAAGQYFAGSYAMFSGLLFFGTAGLVLAPIFHRILHRFHMEDASGDESR